MAGKKNDHEIEMPLKQKKKFKGSSMKRAEQGKRKNIFIVLSHFFFFFPFFFFSLPLYIPLSHLFYIMKNTLDTTDENKKHYIPPTMTLDSSEYDTISNSHVRTDTLDPPTNMETVMDHPETRPRDMMPDFRNLGKNNHGLQTELGTSNAQDIMQALALAQRKPLPSSSSTYTTLKRSSTLTSQKSTTSASAEHQQPTQQRIPDWYRVGWTAFSAKPNPGGPLPFLATEKAKVEDHDMMFDGLWQLDWWQQTGVIFVIGTGSWLLAYLGGGPVSFIVLCLFLGK